MKPEWRPDDWKYYGVPDGFEAGASAMLSALLKWLDETCKTHSSKPDYLTGYQHRYLCPQCMAELKESGK